jgi:hypothetical protein
LIFVGVVDALAFFVFPDRREDPSYTLVHVFWIVLTLAGGIGIAASNVVGWIAAIAATLAVAAGIVFVYVMVGGGDPTLFLILLTGTVMMLAALLWPTTVRWALARLRRDRLPA